MKNRNVSSFVTLTVLYTVTALIVLFVFLVRPGITGHHHADFHEMIEGTADKPFVTRALLPVTVRVLSDATPQSFKNAVASQVRGRRMIAMLDWQDPYLYEFMLASLVMLVCFVGFAFSLRALTAHFHDFPPVLVNVAPVIAFMMLPLFFRYYSYLYDPSNLFLFTTSLLLLVRRQFGWFVLCFVLTALNKETSILLVALYVWFEKFSDKRTVIPRTFVLLLLWALARAMLMFVYRDNSGVMLEHHFHEHTMWLLTKFPVALRYTLVVIALFAICIRHDWHEKSSFLKGGLVITLVPLFVGGLFFGFADELRGYYEVFPFLFLLSIPSIYRFLRHSN